MILTREYIESELDRLKSLLLEARFGTRKTDLTEEELRELTEKLWKLNCILKKRALK